MESVQVFNGVPAKCLSFGKMSGGKSDEDPEYLILLMPGNPGVIEYYRDFMQELYNLLSKDHRVQIVGVSHGGHEMSGIDHHFPDIDDHEELYDLKGQIKAKLDFVLSMNKKAKLILIGHSIGSKMLLESLAMFPAEVAARVVRCYLLFPTIHRMKETPNGRWFWPLFPYKRIIYYLLLPILMLPAAIKYLLIMLYFMGRTAPPCIYKATIELTKPKVYKHITWLAHAELTQVNNLEPEVLKANKDKLFFYFGRTDNWCPLSWAQEIIDAVPGLKYEICSRGIAHAFVIQSSHLMATILAEKITQEDMH